MILNIDHYTPMRLVYELSKELRDDPEYVAKVQALTLNPNKPRSGLKGSHGLFGSEEWWSSIRTGRIRTEVVRGVIEDLYFAGQDSRWGDEVNSFRLRTEDGQHFNESIYVQRKEDQRLFHVGASVWIAYAFDEMKRQPAPAGGTNYSKTCLEMAVSMPGSIGTR